MYITSDYVGSDDLDAVLELSREEHNMKIFKQGGNFHTEIPLYSRKQELKERIRQFDAEIDRYEEDIRSTKVLLDLRKEERQKLLKELEATRPYAGKGKGKAKDGIDYGNSEFEWSRGLKTRMKAIFGIDNFRLCQEGVCNANMDGRDIVCVMPTGGGKSLTYQLPALLQQGCTLVISPLISLITDQILHLQDAGVQAVKLTGGTSKAESLQINRRLLALAGRRVESNDEEIKLCYVTPEKIAKSKSFLSLLQKLVGASQLARIVIDEAHCVSQLGHDFRPDYQKLRTLRQLFPRVPIMALSATCPPKVLEDLIQTLGLRSVVDGNNADTQGTAYFAAPLYRKNLHYSVQPKPAKGSDVLKVMADYILERHPNQSGIVYCLSKKDAEGVAEGLMKLSEGKIKTGVYHAERHDREKENLHVAWRRGTIKVVCATIAFGLGIDKGDVRFVLHHSLSKSLEGYYQESGRAGRDGKDSDCVLYYRPQDGTTLSSMVAHEKEGRIKLHSMLNFAQNLEECRKTQFAKYFSHSSQLSMASWTTSDSDALTRCGHCDNCTRPAEQIDRRDVTLETWQLLKITDAVNQDGANLTLNMLASLARGAGGGVYEVTRGGKGKRGKGKEKEKVELDLDLVAGGAVKLTKDEIEYLLVELLIQRYLEEKYHQTAYATNVYLSHGPLAPRLTRHTREALGNLESLRVQYLFRKRMAKSDINGRARTNKEKAHTNGINPKKATGPIKKGKRKRDISSSEEDEGVTIALDDEDGSEIEYQHIDQQRRESISDCDDDDDIDDWSHTMRPRARSSPLSKKQRDLRLSDVHTTVITENNKEVLVLSD